MSYDAMMKRAKFAPTRPTPHGWIQWKGTDVCMDVRCSCGALTHLDAEFAYTIQCGACGAKFHVNPHVELVPVEASDELADVLVTQGDG